MCKRPVLKIGMVMLMIVVAGVLSFAEGQQEDNKIVVATDATWPPMEYVNEEKEIVGFDIDLMKAVALLLSGRMFSGKEHIFL